MARRQWCGLVSAVALAIGPSVAHGQIPYGKPKPNQQQQLQQQQQKQANQDFHAKGELEATNGAVFKAVLDGQPWLLKLDPKAKVIVTGTATSEFLAPGMFVKFKAEFDKKGKASEPVKELEIFTPNEKDMVGATPAGNGFDAAAAKKGLSAAPVAYEIAGKITAIKKGTIMVLCPNLTVHADVAPEASIKVSVAELSLASPGDKIEVGGWYIKGKEGIGMAREVSVQLANTLSGPTKKKGPARLAKAGEKSSDAADATSPDEKKLDKNKKLIDPKATDSKTDDEKKPADAKKPDDAKPDNAKPAEKDKPDAAK